MIPHNKNVLIIDDKIAELREEITDPLKEMGYNIVPIESPKSGIDSASHHYGIILIDYEFKEPDKYTGADLCKIIRKKCPLSVIILVTGTGKEYISNFISRDWDGYFEKAAGGRLPSKYDQYLSTCLDEAIRNRYDSVPYLKDIPNDKLLEKSVNLLDDLEAYFKSNSRTKTHTVDAVAKDLNLGTGNNLSQKFQIAPKDDNGEPIGSMLFKKGLVFRHLIINNPDKWNLSKKYVPNLKELVDYYRI
ncbi:MAG: response regulator [Bacteroidota bacterium]